MLITGTTRSGKTRLLEVLAAEVIRGSGAVVILDPKGDRDLLARCAAEAHRQDRPFACLSPAFPAQSARMNVLDTAGTPAEVAARIKALMPSPAGVSAPVTLRPTRVSGVSIFSAYSRQASRRRRPTRSVPRCLRRAAPRTSLPYRS